MEVDSTSGLCGDTGKIAGVTSPSDGALVKRHRLSTRIWHWTNVITLCIMMMSGLMILNAHPRLYWGKFGANPDHAWLVLGDEGGAPFPGWITIPSHYSPADARIWHFAFAWVLALGLAVYLLRSLFNGHVRRDLHITRREWSPGHLWHDIKEHAALRFPTGEAALRYNVLQKLAYCGVLFGLLPLIILTGLAMSPALNAALPFLTEIFGGRQSARSLHFLCMCGLIAFFIVHMAMVLLAGPINEVRSMITGKYRLPVARQEDRTDV
ncbi:MAG: cytochrome b/b6 domain-containing protein [Novosphingobium sp.]